MGMISRGAARARMSKVNDNGSGCSADGNLVVESSIYDSFLRSFNGKAVIW